jgi:hypothetical protein
MNNVATSRPAMNLSDWAHLRRPKLILPHHDAAA